MLRSFVRDLSILLFYNTNITLYTENEKCIYKVFSIYKIESEDYYITTEFENDKKFEQFVNTIKKRSIKEFDIDVSESDNILTFFRCRGLFRRLSG